MTPSRQRPGRPSPPLNSREAALVGALTAFAKAPAAATGPGFNKTRQAPLPGPKPGQNVRSNAHKPSVDTNPAIPGKPAPSVALNKPVRHDSGTVSAVNSKPIETRNKSSRETLNSIDQELGPEIHGAGKGARPDKKRITPKKKQSPATSRSATPHLKSSPVAGDGLDETPLPSTPSLVQLFEQKGTTKAAIGHDTPLKSPKPVRRPLVLRQDDQTVSTKVSYIKHNDESDTVPNETPLSGKSGRTDPSSLSSFASARDTFSPLKEHQDEPKSTLNLDDHPVSSSISERLAPPRRESHSNHSPQYVHAPSTSPGSNYSPPHHLHNANLSPYSHESAATSTASITATYNALHPRRLSALRTGDSLANAIVASSLASSRAPSPQPAKHLHPPPLLPRRSHHSLFSRTPSPPKPPPERGMHMRQTLRKAKSSLSDDESDDDPYAKHKRKRHIHKHANKYAEGDRKRWRNVVSPRERARYEGVWAANRGPLVPVSSAGGTPPADEAEADSVHALAVKHIWTRSRLPEHILEEIWGLVDGGKVGRLTREEFVVGLWLVDQRLKGRKLPVRVGESVWESVRTVRGIRLRGKMK